MENISETAGGVCSKMKLLLRYVATDNAVIRLVIRFIKAVSRIAALEAEMSLRMAIFFTSFAFVPSYRAWNFDLCRRLFIFC